MNGMRKVAAAVSIGLFASQPALAAAAEKPCITAEEMHAGITYLLPALVEGVQKKCAAALPKDAYLATKGVSLVDSYKALARPESPELTSLIAKIGMPKDIPASATKPMAEMVSLMVVSKLQEDLKTDICPPVDRALALLDPLPAANMVGLIELMVAEIVQDEAKKRSKAGQPPKQVLCTVVATVAR